MTQRKTDGSKRQVDLTYITPRGLWYDYSWKGIFEKSGGIIYNIGIHFFDILLNIFGPVTENIVTSYSKRESSGILELETASVKWKLSVDKDDLQKIDNKGDQRFRQN